MNNTTFYSVFSLFHHDIDFEHSRISIDTQNLYQHSKEHAEFGIKDLAEILLSVVAKNANGMDNKEVSITITGGMDSRVILAALLNLGIKPNCLVFGDPESRDVIISKGIAKSLGLRFHNACSIIPDKEWYYNWVIKTIEIGEGSIHLHRAHRTAAISEHADLYHPKVLFTGHMGGEGLRGLSYNNYFSSDFFRMVNEDKMPIKHSAENILKSYFISDENINWQELLNLVETLPWMTSDRERNKFFYLYDFVAKIHHAQDLSIYGTYIPKVIPVYLDGEYLRTLFSSPFHCLNKTGSISDRLQNPEVYCSLLEILFPDLLKFPLANGFTPLEYQKGLCYFVPLKIFRDLTRKKRRTPNFSYKEWYVSFIREHALKIDPSLWEIYNREEYFAALNKPEHGSDEGYWHKFSNPVFFDLANKHRNGAI